MRGQGEVIIQSLYIEQMPDTDRTRSKEKIPWQEYLKVCRTAGTLTAQLQKPAMG